MKTYKGKCSCGAIEYSFEDEPINSAFCYCHACQTHTGTDKWFGLWVMLDKFTFTKGHPSIYTRLGDSGKEMHYNFCSQCGTTVCIEVTIAGIYSVAASSVVTENNFSPAIAIYTASAPKWAVFPENTPRFDILPPEMSI